MIKDIGVKNFKSFIDAKITFSPLTLLTGVNGSGKSSVFQILLLLRQSFQQSRLLNVGLSLNGDLVSLGVTQDVLSEYATKDEICLSLNLNDDALGLWNFSAKEKQFDYLPIINFECKEDFFDKSSLFTTGFHYLKAERFGPRVVLPKDDYYVRTFKDVGVYGEFSSHFLEIYGEEEISSSLVRHPNTESMKIIDNVRLWLSEICPNTILKTQSHPDTDYTSLRYGFAVDKDTSNYYRATNVGFGVSYILPIIINALSCEKGHLFLVDTPEAHLHPRGQSNIGKLLGLSAKSGVQVVIETHSDHVLNGVRELMHSGFLSPNDATIHYLSRSPDSSEPETNVESLTIDKDGRISNWPIGFFDQWDISLQALLTPKS